MLETVFGGGGMQEKEIRSKKCYDSSFSANIIAGINAREEYGLVV